MRSIVSRDFRKMLDALPERIQAMAREGFERWKHERSSVGWKRLHGPVADLHSVQIGHHHRAIALVSKEHGAVMWLFVGSHETYNHFIKAQLSTSQKAFIERTGLAERMRERREHQGEQGEQAGQGLNPHGPEGHAMSTRRGSLKT